MERIFEKLAKNVWVKTIGSVAFTIIPAFDFYSNLIMSLFGRAQLGNIHLSKSLIDIITGLLLGGIFLLFLQSKNEYTRIKKENQRIREMFLAIHIFDNIRFTKLSNVLPSLFQNEEQHLERQLPAVFRHDLGTDYTDEQIKELLDCFYRNKPKFS